MLCAVVPVGAAVTAGASDVSLCAADVGAAANPCADVVVAALGSVSVAAALTPLGALALSGTVPLVTHLPLQPSQLGHPPLPVPNSGGGDLLGCPPTETEGGSPSVYLNLS